MFEPVPKYCCILHTVLKCYKCRQEFDEEYEKTFVFALFLLCVCVLSQVFHLIFPIHSSFGFHEYFKAFVITLSLFEKSVENDLVCARFFSILFPFCLPAYL